MRAMGCRCGRERRRWTPCCIRSAPGKEHQSARLRGVAGLPDGVFVRWRHAGHLAVGGHLLAWTLEGYVPAVQPPHTEVEIITPPAIVAALSAGYRPMLHPTADRCAVVDGVGRIWMTRSSLRSTLRRSYWLLALVLAISLATKLAEHIPGIAGGPLEKLATDVYEYLKDMALVFVTVVAAYLASVFQKRHSFIEALREEWRDIIKAKSALFAYTQIEKPTQRDYVAAFCAISETHRQHALGLQERGRNQSAGRALPLRAVARHAARIADT